MTALRAARPARCAAMVIIASTMVVVVSTMVVVVSTMVVVVSTMVIVIAAMVVAIPVIAIGTMTIVVIAVVIVAVVPIVARRSVAARMGHTFADIDIAADVNIGDDRARLQYGADRNGADRPVREAFDHAHIDAAI